MIQVEKEELISFLINRSSVKLSTIAAKTFSPIAKAGLGPHWTLPLQPRLNFTSGQFLVPSLRLRYLPRMQCWIRRYTLKSLYISRALLLPLLSINQ